MVLVTPLDSVYARVEAEKRNKIILSKQEEVIEYLIRTGELTGVNLDETYIYPSGHKKHNKGFFLDNILKDNIDNYLIPAVDMRWDGVFLLTGMEGCICSGGVVLMADGTWKNVEDIKIGDIVLSPQFDKSYKYSTVLKTYKWLSKKNYSVSEKTRAKEYIFTCSYNHGLPILQNNINNKLGEITADEFFNIKSQERISLLTAPPIEKYMNRQNCEIEPYTLGAFLGDGSFTNILRISNSYNDINIIKEINKHYTFSSKYIDRRRLNNIVTTYSYSKKSKLYDLLVKYKLRYMTSKYKFIPREAMLSDINYRIKLLSGLLDTDGSIHKNTYSIKTVSPQLAEDIKNLVYSLGGRARINKDDWAIKNTKNGNRYYQISFYISDIKLKNKIKRKTKNVINSYKSNKIKIILNESGEDYVYGFLLDSPSHMFITNKWCCSFNSGKTNLGSTIAKYLDPTFPGEPISEKNARRKCDRIVFSPQQFFNAVDNSKPKQAILFDEAILGLMAGDAGTNIQKMLMRKLTLIRKKQLFIILIIPSIFSMRMPIAVTRTRFLVHTFSPDGIKRGYMKFYNYPTKRMLYMRGKRDVNQDAVEPSFMGKFVDTEGLFYDIHEYDKKKDEAINNLSLTPGRKGQINLADYKTKGQRDLLLSFLYAIIEGTPLGKDQLEYLVKLNNEFAMATKVLDRLNPRKFKEFLDNTFGEHMDISESALREYLKAAQEYASKPVNPLVVTSPIKEKDEVAEAFEKEIEDVSEEEGIPKEEAPIEDHLDQET